MENTQAPPTETQNPQTKKPLFGPIRPGLVIALLATIAVAGALTLKKSCYYKKTSIQTVELQLEMPSTIRMQAIGGKLQSLQVIQEKPHGAEGPLCRKSYPPAQQCPAIAPKKEETKKTLP